MSGGGGGGLEAGRRQEQLNQEQTVSIVRSNSRNLASKSSGEGFPGFIGTSCLQVLSGDIL